jgi:hypothetical protein
MILSASQIQGLTGYTRHSAQIRWLQKNGYRYRVNALGQPIVAVAEFNRLQVGGVAARTQEPNWDAMNDGTKAAHG